MEYDECDVTHPKRPMILVGISEFLDKQAVRILSADEISSLNGARASYNNWLVNRRSRIVTVE